MFRRPAYHPVSFRGRKPAEQGNPFNPMNVASLRSDGGVVDAMVQSGFAVDQVATFNVDWMAAFSGVVRKT